MYQLFLISILILFHNVFCLNNKNEKPIIDELFTSPTLKEGKKFYITCSTSKGQVQFSWLLNGQPIVFNENVFTIDHDESSMLNIRSMSLEYAGEYTCKIRNSVNEHDSRTVSVKLNGKSSLDNQMNCKYNLTFCI